MLTIRPVGLIARRVVAQAVPLRDPQGAAMGAVATLHDVTATRAAGGEFVRYEVDAPGADGRLHPFDFSLKPIRDDEGAVTMIIAEGRDISDKRRREEEARRNEAELALILNSVPVGIFYKDDRNRILRVNEAVAQGLGRSVAEIEGRHVQELFPERAAQYHADDLEVIASRQPKFGVVESYVDLDGKQRWVRKDKVPYVDPATGQRSVSVALTDITAERAAEEALRASEEGYRQLYTRTLVMLHSIDQQVRLISVSDFWLARLGYTRDEVIGRPSTDFLTPGSRRR